MIIKHFRLEMKHYDDDGASPGNLPELADRKAKDEPSTETAIGDDTDSGEVGETVHKLAPTKCPGTLLAFNHALDTKSNWQKYL